MTLAGKLTESKQLFKHRLAPNERQLCSRRDSSGCCPDPMDRVPSLLALHTLDWLRWLGKPLSSGRHQYGFTWGFARRHEWGPYRRLTVCASAPVRGTDGP